jgi:predicted peptidase
MYKYHNRKVKTNDGIVHDSRKEAVRWEELKLLEKAGAITDLKRQMEFLLIPPQYEEITTGKRKKKTKRKLVERSVVYIADFVYHDETGDIVVEDTKGFKTRDYIIKRKLMRYVYGITIKEV